MLEELVRGTVLRVQADHKAKYSGITIFRKTVGNEN